MKLPKFRNSLQNLKMNRFAITLIAILCFALGTLLTSPIRAALDLLFAPDKKHTELVYLEHFLEDQFLSQPQEWSKELKKATEYIVSRHGGTIKFMCGKTYNFNTPQNLDHISNVSFEGCATDYEQQGRPATIRYTGSGSEPAFSLKSTYGLRFKNVKIEYTNPGFTGILLDLSHSERTLGDSAYNTIQDSTLMGTPEANNASALVFLGGGIISRIETTHFFHARVGIKGVEPHSPRGNHYAYVFTVARNSFNAVDVAILNPSSNWTIDNNTFEPNRFGELVVLENDCGDACVTASGSTFSNNYIGDGHAQEKPIVRLRKCTAWNIFGNMWYSDTEVSRAAITLDGCEDVKIQGNHAQPFKTFVETAGKTSFGITIDTNKINANELLRETAQCAGCNIFQASLAGTSPRMTRLTALQAHSWATPGNSVFDIAFGMKGRADQFKSAGVFNIVDYAYGLPNGTLFLTSGQNGGIAQVALSPENTPTFVAARTKNTSVVPLEVPDEPFSQRWKTSNETVTKAAIYRIFKQRIAEEIQPLIDATLKEKLAEIQAQPGKLN